MSAPTRLAALMVALSLGGGIPAAAQEWVSHVKTRPLDFEGREILLEGEAVEVRALSPRSARGIYRLVDGSDPVGVLVRTDDLPMAGGPFRVRARLAPELMHEGHILLDETDRRTEKLPLMALTLVVVGAGLVGVAITGFLYHRMRRDERHLRLGRPMWLIPVDDTTRQPAAGTPAPFDYHLQYIEQERSAQFERRRRTLLLTLAVSTAVTVVGAGGTVALRVADASRPSFVLLLPEFTAESRPGGPDTTVSSEPEHDDDPIRVGLVPPPAQPTAPRPRVDPPPQRAAESVAPAQQPTGTARAVPESVLALPPREPVVLPPPPLTPAPPVAAPVEEAARPDPAALLAAAVSALEAGGQRLVQALNSRSVEQVGGLVQAAGNASRRDRFLQFVRESNPAATLVGADPPVVSDDQAGGGITIGLRWRGDFGVQRQRSVRFFATLRRVGEGWTFEGARLLEAFP